VVPGLSQLLLRLAALIAVLVAAIPRILEFAPRSWSVMHGPLSEAEFLFHTNAADLCFVPRNESQIQAENAATTTPEPEIDPDLGIPAWALPGEAAALAAGGMPDSASERSRKYYSHDTVPPEPVFQHWVDRCKALNQSHMVGPYGPFSRQMPGRASEIMPSLEKVVEYITRGKPTADYMKRAQIDCANTNLPGSRRSQKDDPTPLVAKGLQCFRQGQPRKYATFVQHTYGLHFDNLMRRLGYANRTVLTFFGDGWTPTSLPHFVKARPTRQRITEPYFTMWMNGDNHFGELSFFNKFVATLGKWKDAQQVMPEDVLEPVGIGATDDVPQVKEQLGVCQSFSSKSDTLVWRGATTGSPWKGSARQTLLLQYGAHQKPNIDVGVTAYVQGVTEDVGPKVSQVPRTTMAQHKFLLVVLGNDVAASSAWSLLSASAVLMADPLQESMVLQGLLQPWVHYIPVKKAFTDLEEKMAWCLQNLDECEDIAHRASIFMYNMWPGQPFAEKVAKAVFDKYFEWYGEIIKCACDDA